MTHEIEDNERLVFVGSRNDIWHSLGTEIAPGTDIREGAQQAGIDTRIEVLPITVQVPIEIERPLGSELPTTEMTTLNTGKNAIVRMPHEFNGVQHPAKFLGTCSARYYPLQNMDLIEAFRGVSKYYPLETAGSLKGGEIAFFTLNAGVYDVKSNGKSDAVKSYFYAIDRKIPGSMLNLGAGGTRIVCMNTLIGAETSARILIPLQHSADIGKMVSAIAEQLQRLGSMQKATFEAYQMMANTPMTIEQAKATFEVAWAMPELSTTILSLDTLNNPIDMETASQTDLVANAIARSVPIQEKVASAQAAIEIKSDLVKYFRSVAETALGNMTDNEGLGLNAWTVFNAVGETVEHRKDRTRGNVPQDMLIGERARTMDRTAQYIMDIVRKN